MHWNFWLRRLSCLAIFCRGASRGIGDRSSHQRRPSGHKRTLRSAAELLEARILLSGDSLGGTGPQTVGISVVAPGLFSESSGSSEFSSAISPDGRYIAFSSVASNLVPGDTNNATDVFLFDRQTETTQLVSTTSSGTQGNGNSSGNRSPSVAVDGSGTTYVASRVLPRTSSVGTRTFSVTCSSRIWRQARRRSSAPTVTASRETAPRFRRR